MAVKRSGEPDSKRKVETPLVPSKETLERVEKGLKGKSVQDRYRLDDKPDDFVPTMFYWANAWEKLPEYGSGLRTRELRKFWRGEPIMAGAIYSMCAKMASMGWMLSGEEQQVEFAHQVLSNASGGMGWTYMMEQVCQDVFGSDTGGTIELLYPGGKPIPPVIGMFAVDAERIRLRDNLDSPCVYVDETRMKHRELLVNEIIRIVSLPSPCEKDKGLGFCSVSRCAEASWVLKFLWQYDQEMLNDMPPNGFIGVSGIHPRVLEAQLQKYKEQRASRGDLLFPGLFWLASSGKIDLDVLSFRVLPEGLNRQEMTEIYAKVLALAFGVDVAEFWQIEHSGATKAATTVQAKKAQGKGPAEVLSYLERGINSKVLADIDVWFRFDEPDDEADMMRAERFATVSASVAQLYMAQRETGEPLLPREKALKILVDEGLLSAEYLEDTGDTVGTDEGILEVSNENMTRRLVERAFTQDMRLKRLYDSGANVVGKRMDGSWAWFAAKKDAPKKYRVAKFTAGQLSTLIPSAIAARDSNEKDYDAKIEDDVALEGDGTDKGLSREELAKLFDEWVEWSKEAE